jgi:hypothetical protein
MATSINDVDIFEPKKDLLDRGVEAYDENVPLLAKLAIGFTPQGLAIDGAELAKYGRDAFRDFGSGDYKEGAMNLGLAGLSGVGFIPFAGDLLKAGGKQFAKGKIRGTKAFNDLRAKPLTPTVGNPTFEAPLRAKSKDLEKAVDRQMNKHQQNFTSPEELFETAKSANKPFQKEIDDVAMNLKLRTAESPGEVITDPALMKYIKNGLDTRTGNAPGTVKLIKSMKRKAKDKYDGDFTQITDPIRTRVIANTTQEADEFASQIANRYPTKDSGNQISGLGLRDRKLNIQYTSPNGEKIIAEISIVPQAMKDASELTHPIYNKWRVLDGQYKNVKEMPPQVLDQLDEFKQLQLDIFADAEKSLDPSWLSDEIVKKFAKGGAVAYEGY